MNVRNGTPLLNPNTNTKSCAQCWGGRIDYSGCPDCKTDKGKWGSKVPVTKGSCCDQVEEICLGFTEPDPKPCTPQIQECEVPDGVDECGKPKTKKFKSCDCSKGPGAGGLIIPL